MKGSIGYNWIYKNNQLRKIKYTQMNIHFDEGSKEALYLQLYEKLKADIVDGTYPYGSKLPSKRGMAAETGLSSITVKHAYELLCDEGYLESRERSGFYAAFRREDGFLVSPPPARPAAFTAGAVPEYAFPFSVLAKTMRRVMSNCGEMIISKSPGQGLEELREALCRYLARNKNIHAVPEQIIIGSGAEYLYSIIAGLLGNGRPYALEDPSYEKIEIVYKMAGISCDKLPLGHDGIRSSALSKTKARVIHISPYRSFPTGITASASKRYEYIRWAAESDRYIVEDDFESEFSVSSKPEETMFSMSSGENVIYMNTFTKTISPSLRVGYMVIPEKLIGVFRKKLGILSCTVPTFEQLVIAELLNSGDFERHINRVRRLKRKDLKECLS